VATGLYDRLAQGSDLQLGYFLVPAVAMAAPAVLVFTGRADITTAARWSALALGAVVIDDLGWDSSPYGPQILCSSVSALALVIAAGRAGPSSTNAALPRWFRLWSTTLPAVSLGLTYPWIASAFVAVGALCIAVGVVVRTSTRTRPLLAGNQS